MTFDVNGATYTGTFSVTGDSNNIDFNCDSTNGNSSCGTATASIVWVGSSNDLDIDIGETSDASYMQQYLLLVQVVVIVMSVAATIDGTSAIITLSINGDTNNLLS